MIQLFEISIYVIPPHPHVTAIKNAAKDTASNLIVNLVTTV